jgi:putative glutamine amidotransferase
MPTIGLTSCSRLADYEHQLERVGVEWRLLTPDQDPVTALDGLDGLVLSGGGDIDPSLYGETPHETFSADTPGRDQFEIALVGDAFKRRLPLLAICRGIQVLNVAAGGTLVQDIPSSVPGALDHQVRTTPSTIAHEVWVTAGTRLAQLMADRLEGDVLLVNSRHHQAVKKVAPGFVVSATAPDGVIEGIERPDLPYCVGVQWHPENFYRTGEFRALFEGLVRAVPGP